MEDFEEASICHAHNASKACVVMCGSALEGLTIEQNAEGRTLYEKIKYLYEKSLIFKILYDAFTKIRIYRNLGAHPQSFQVTEGEDKKILDITSHIIEHV